MEISKKKVTLFKNGVNYKTTPELGRSVIISHICDWDDFLNNCVNQFCVEKSSTFTEQEIDFKKTPTACKIYNEQGGEIEDLNELVENEILFVAEHGEAFTLPLIPKNNTLRNSEWITLNVCGRMFTTTRSTVTKDPDSMLLKMFGSDWNSKQDSRDAYLLDRSPKYFSVILEYLRSGQLIVPESINPEGVLQEAIFFNISSLLEPLQKMTKDYKEKDHAFSRRDFVLILCGSSCSSALRGQGTDLKNVDLSKLDLGYINLRMSNLESANLERTTLDNTLLQEANMGRANMSFSKLRGANLGRANLEEVNLKGALLDDRGGLRANLEGCNARGSILDDCNLSGANLRAANLKGCSLENANLLRADLAGADLEGVNLRGANLNKANLMGANLKGANFDIRTTVSSRQ